MIDKYRYKELISKINNKDYLFNLYAKFGICQDYLLITEIDMSTEITNISISPNVGILLNSSNYDALLKNLKIYLDSDGKTNDLYKRVYCMLLLLS